MKRSAIALLLILLMLVSALAAIGNVMVTSAASENWVEVARYSGEFTSLHQPKFTVSHFEWRARWRIVKHDIGGNLFRLELSLFRARELVGSVTREHSDPTSGIIVVHNQNRTFSIYVDAAPCKEWEVVIDENVNSPLLDIAPQS